MKLISPRTITITLLILVFALYTNSVFNKYTLDDAIVITENEFTKKGMDGIKEILSNDTFTGFYGKQKKLVSGGRYRPLSLVTFAVEYEIFGMNPHISHGINLLLYAIIVLMVFKIIDTMFEKKGKKPWFSLAFVTALLFATHPIHTEVVANIKGRDELLALLGSLVTLQCILNFVKTRRESSLVFALIIFFLALMAKENAITFLLIIPIAVYYYQKEHAKIKTDLIISSLILIIPTAGFLFIRYKVLGGFDTQLPGELMNNPFIHATTGQKYATIFYTLGFYIKLLIYPHPLTFDYYPYHIQLLEMNNWIVIGSILGYVLIAFFALFGMVKRDLKAFAIILYLLPLSIVSNILFPVGVFMNERFIFFSSIGFCLIAAWFIVEKLPHIFRSRILSILFLLALLGMYSFKTIERNFVWKDNFTLFTTDVKTSYNSAKSNTTAGGLLMERAKETDDKYQRERYYKQSLLYLNRAVKIHPTYTDAWILLGNTYYGYNSNIDSALYCYFKILSYKPTYERAFTNAGVVLNNAEDVDFKINGYMQLLEIRPNDYNTNYQLGVLYGRYKNQLENAIPYLEKAVELNPDDIAALKDLSVAYGMNLQFNEAIEIVEKAISLSPEDIQLYINQGINYRSIGNLTKANEYFIKAEELKGESDD